MSKELKLGCEFDFNWGKLVLTGSYDFSELGMGRNKPKCEMRTASGIVSTLSKHKVGYAIPHEKEIDRIRRAIEEHKGLQKFDFTLESITKP